MCSSVEQRGEAGERGVVRRAKRGDPGRVTERGEEGKERGEQE